MTIQTMRPRSMSLPPRARRSAIGDDELSHLPLEVLVRLLAAGPGLGLQELRGDLGTQSLLARVAIGPVLECLERLLRLVPGTNPVCPDRQGREGCGSSRVI